MTNDTHAAIPAPGDTIRTDDAARRAPADPGRFVREGGRNRFTARPATVVRVERVAPAIVRVTLAGPDLADFTSIGPADHVRVFFPDAATGELVAPVSAGPGQDGIVRPDAPTIARDFTPIPRAVPGGVEVDLDFFTHPDPGPASAWAERAQPGDRLVVVGPRGSRRAPQDLDALLLVCDETSLPSASRWLRDIPAGIAVDVIATVHGDGSWVAGYLGEVAGVDVRLRLVDADAAADGALDALRSLGPIGDGTFVWAAGEASALVSVRRYLRRELGLPAAQAVVSGYWRRGEAGFDHHAPIDPSDPD